MPAQKTWDQLTAELSQLSNNNNFILFRPLLESLQRMASAQYPTPDVVSGVLDIVKHIQADASQGPDPAQLARELAGKAAQGFIQPQWNVLGNVNQANRDLFNQVFVTVFNNNLGELKPPDTGIPVPVVLLVMTYAEAQQLVSGEAFKDYPDVIYVQQFNQLHTLLNEKKISDWAKRYKGSPEDWQPFAANADTVTDLVRKAMGDVEGYQKPLVPEFIDIRTLNEDTKPKRRILRDLREKGCVVLMDVISMWHPLIQRAYRRSLLDAFPNVLIVRIAPISDALNVMQQMIRFSEQYVDLEFYKRFRVDMDGKCDEVSDDFIFARWLVDQTPKLLPEDERAKAGIRAHMYK